MNGRFWVFGVFVSVLVHAAFLFVLSVSSTGTTPTVHETATSAAEVPSEPLPETPPVSKPIEPDVKPVVSTPVPAPVTLPNARPIVVNEPAPTPEVEWVTYTVKKGDWLERLCKKAGCSVSEAVRYNKTTYKNLSNLKIGQKIRLPKFKEN